MKTVTINLYSFSELSKDAQRKAIDDHANFLSSTPMDCEDEDGEMIEEYQDEFEDEEVIDNIEANDYVFYEDGSLAKCVTYCGGHPKTGITEFDFKGRIYDITK